MDNMQCNDIVDMALAELVGLQNRSMHYTPGTTTISSSPSFGQNRKFSPHFSCQGSGITSSTVSSSAVQKHSKYIAKITSPRKSSEVQAFRMRPYFLPERSRTKSESLDHGASGEALPNLCQSTNTGTTNSASYSRMRSSALVMDTGTRPGIQLAQHSAVSDAPRVERRLRLKLISNALKKSKSMEDVRVEANVDGSQLSHEMEFVSSRIEKLKMQPE